MKNRKHSEVKSMKKLETVAPNDSQEGLEATMMPPWVQPLLSTKFYSNCPNHPHKECNMFCINCSNDAFCCHCRNSLHPDHSVLQIRRSSYENAVRVMEVEKVLDMRGIQAYVINHYKVVYLNQRAQRKPPINGISSRRCVICDRSLMDNSLFCSLKCKFEGSKISGNASSVNNCENNIENASKGEGEGEEKTRSCKIKIKERLSSPPSNSRKRKGIPQRAPLSGHLEGVL